MSAPLHPWLLAVSLPLSSDPVTAGRLLSLVCGVVLVPAVAWLVWELGRALGDGFAPAAVASAALVTVSPFLVFASRLARVDALFLLEVALVTGLSIALASRAAAGRLTAAMATAFGIVMGATMLTRQAVSYPLWLLPPIAFFCGGRRNGRVLLRPLVTAVAIALALWTPMLVAPAWPDLTARIFHLDAYRPVLGMWDRAGLFARNLGVGAAAFWTYLTPPVLLAGVAGFALLFARRRRVFTFLAGWEALLLVPPALFAAEYFPRYALPAALPLLAGAGFATAFAWTPARRPIRVALVVAVLAWPVIDVARGLANWHAWRLLPIDRRQFVSGWSAGLASQRAAAFLTGRAQTAPIDVVVPTVSGNPSDAIWLRLDGVRNIRLSYAEDFLQRPALEVRGDIWAVEPPTNVPADRPVYLVSPDPVFLGREGWAPAREVVLPLNPGARLVARFENLPDERGRVESAVMIYRLR